MSQYIFDKNADDRELRRLRMIEAAVDAETIELLNESGVRAGWTCLELGAGAGSIVEWMGARVGAQGTVLAVDKKPVYLGRFDSPPYRVIDGDFLSCPDEPPLDLLHARYVLIHNRRDDAMLKKVRAMIKPGGVVVLEEPDFTSARLLNGSDDSALQRVNDAICRMFTNAGLDPGYGLSLARKVSHAGFDVIRVRATLHLTPGRSPIADLMAESALVLRAEYTGTGCATDQDIGSYVAHAQDPSYWSVYYSTVSVLARPRFSNG